MTLAQALSKCEFIKSYEGGIRSLADRLKGEQPDLVIALSRKAPRLLELLSAFGIDYGNSLIITEKAVDFLSKECFRDKVVWILDDIVIVGTTIYRYLTEDFKDRLSLSRETRVMCLAMDSEWIQEKLFTADEIADHKLHAELRLKGKETTIFCNELVRSFRYLNKPYDIDHAILYGEIGPERFTSLDSWQEKLHEISTVYQVAIERRSFTAIPPEDTTSDFVKRVVKPCLRCSSAIGKWRLYYNRTSSELTIVPILTLSVDADALLTSEGPFTEKFDAYNSIFRLINNGSGKLERKRLGLFWFLTSYLWGIYFLIRNNLGDGFKKPLSFLRSQDLVYLFGPELTKTILDTLDTNFSHSKEILIEPSTGMVQDVAFSVPGADSTWGDPEAQELYEHIGPYIGEQANAVIELPLLDRLALIFEALFYMVELPFRQELRRKLAEVQPYSQLHEVMKSIENQNRLRIGFTWEQLLDILDENGLAHTSNPDVVLGLSLALDLLVDSGVAIPILYFNKSAKRWERIYRFGEDVLSAKKTSVLFHRLKEYLAGIYGKVDRLSFEKMYVLLLEKARKDKYVDSILAPEFDEDTVRLDIGMCVHGAVVNEGASKRFLSTWLEKEGQEYISAVPQPDLTPISNTVLEDMLRFARVLAYVDMHIDKPLPDRDTPQFANKDSKYLIAVSTVYDYEPYLDAVAEDIRLFLSGYRIDDGVTLIQNLLGFVQNLQTSLPKNQGMVPERKDWLTQTFIKGSLSIPDQACSEVTLKKTLFDRRMEIGIRIDEHFRRLTPGEEMRSAYYSPGTFGLVNKINRITQSHTPSHLDLILNYEAQLLQMADVCRNLSTIVRCIAEILRSFLTRTKNGAIWPSSRTAIERRIRMLTDELLPSLNNSLLKLGAIFMDCSFPHIQDCEGLDTRARENVLEASAYMLSQLHAVFESIENVYRSDFDKRAWRDVKQKLFPEEMPEHFAVIKYDVKGSTRDDEALKKKRWTVRDINQRLIPKLSEEIARGTIIEVAHPHEDGLFLARTEHDIARLVLGLLRAAEENGKSLRVSICSTGDTGIPFMRRRKYFYDDEYRLVTWEEEDRRTGINIDLNYALAARLLEMAESMEDREENKGKAVIQSLVDSCHTLVFSEAVAKAFGFDSADDVRLATGSVTIPRNEGRDYEGLVLLPSHYHVAIDKFQQRL